jgi:hypothetical protein
MKRILGITLLGCFILLLTPVIALAQTEKGAIVGTVTDSNGAAIPNASITITDLRNKATQTFSTNSEGIYNAPFLSPGLYDVLASASGFARSVANNIAVGVASRVRADFVLKVGSLNETITVEDVASLVQTENANIGQSINSRTLTELPSNTRNVYAFLLLNSNVTQPTGGNGPAFRLETGGSFAIAGTRPSSVTFKIDGLSNTDPAFGTPTITPSLDAVQEAQFASNTYSAEFEGIGQVNIATKSGANQFHGSGFDFVQNDFFQPRDPRAAKDKTGKPGKSKLRFNQFGGTIGGPIWLPRFGEGGPAFFNKDRTFFFFSYEGLRANSKTLGFARVPTPAQRVGDFSANLGGCATTTGGVAVPLLNPNGTPSGNCVRVGQIFDPLTTAPNPLFNAGQPISVLNPQFIRQPFANNQIPLARLDPLARGLIDFQLPPENLPGQLNNFIGPTGGVRDYNQYSVRIDHKISNNDNIFGRFAIQNNISFTQPVIILQNKNVQGKGRVFSATWTHVFSPSLVNEFRIGYVRGIYGDSIDEFDPTTLGFKSVGLQTLPRIFLSPENVNYGGFSASVLNEVQNTYQLADNMSVAFGNHDLKFGFKGDHNRFRNGEFGGSNGTGTFSGIYTVAYNGLSANNSNALADFLLGAAQTSSLSIPAPAYLRNTPWAAYVQDDWKWRPRVTFNLGLRYELHQPYHELHKGGFTVDPSNGGTLVVADPEVARIANDPRVVCCTDPGVAPTNKLNFAPRLGVAIQPFKDARTVIRAGYGIFYADMTQFPAWSSYTNLIRPSFNPPVGSYLTLGTPLSDLFPTNRFTQGGFGLILFPSGVPPAILGNKPIISAGGALGTRGVGSQSTPYSQEWSAGVQREIMRNTVAEVNYVGGNGKNLPTQWIFNQPTASPIPIDFASTDPAANPYLRRPFANFTLDSFTIANILQSHYNAVTVKVDKRFSNGYSFLSSYTYSKSIDNGSELFAIGNTFNIISDNRNIDRDRGDSTFDVPHRWVSSGIFELPFGKGKRFLNDSSLVDALVGGWRVSGVFTLQSGYPFTPLIRNRFAHTGYALSTERGDLNGDPYLTGDDWDNAVRAWQNNGARLFFARSGSININYAQGTFGNIPRNFFRAPYGRRLDLSLAKTVHFGESRRFEIRADMFDVTREVLHSLNIASSVSANNLLTNPVVGSIPGRNAFFVPYTFQLGAKVQF